MTSPEISSSASLTGALWPHHLMDDKQNTLLKCPPLPHSLHTTNLEQRKSYFAVFKPASTINPCLQLVLREFCKVMLLRTSGEAQYLI